MQILIAGLLMVAASAHATLVVQSVDSAPAFSTLWQRLCGVAPVPAHDTGLVFGRVAVAVGDPPDSSEIVQAAWSGGNDTRDSSERTVPTVSRVHIKPDGSYAICDVPVHQSILLRAVRGTQNTPTLTFQLAPSRFVRRDLTLLDGGDHFAIDTERPPPRVAAEAGLGAVVAGIIVDPTRHRVVGANVLIRGTTLTAETDETGEFVIEDVPPGTRRIDINAPEWGPLHVLADVYAGDTVTFIGRMTLGSERSPGSAHDSTSSIRGIVMDPQGHALRGAEVRVTSSGRSTRTDSAGRYRLEALVDGPTQLLARLIGWKPVERGAMLTPHSDLVLNFRLVDRAAALDTIRITGTYD
ncbi:MAG: carboxypeptidase-like regulatory domain-containing protein, partial [Gemmatimonadaceae bacterium]